MEDDQQPTRNPTHAGDEDEVDPWHVKASGESGIDYGRLIKNFGCEPISAELIERVERITRQPAHPWLKRGLFFSHRDLDKVLDLYEAGTPFYLYTGRGPSSESLHLGHLIPFMFTLYLQQAFKVPLVIQLTDDEKFVFKNGLSLEKTARLAKKNAKDIIAVGFDPERTFIFQDTEYIRELYPNVCRIQKLVTANQAIGIFGFDGSSNLGQYAYPAIQAAPSFSTSFKCVFGDGPEAANAPCLIPCAIDQDPFFRMTRDCAPRMGLRKPAVIHSKFLDSLQGPKTKMNASDANSSIYLTDTLAQIKTKINKYAFSGGGETRAEQEAHGANLEVDVPYQYLRLFLFDDARVEEIGREYGAGRMMTGQVKAELISVLTELITAHQERRAKVTDETVAAFMAIRHIPLDVKENLD